MELLGLDIKVYLFRVPTYGGRTCLSVVRQSGAFNQHEGNSPSDPSTFLRDRRALKVIIAHLITIDYACDDPGASFLSDAGHSLFPLPRIVRSRKQQRQSPT